MAGIDKIIEQIISQAEDNAKKITDEANAEATNILTQAREDGQAKAQVISQKSEIQSKDIVARGQSAAALYIRKENLKAKQDIITKMLKNAKQAILNLSDKEYCDIILKMIEKHSTNEVGFISFNSKDVKRISSIESNFKKFNLTLSDKTVNIDGGFILIYGDIEENCSITALFDGADEKLQDEVSSMLFSK